MFQYRAVSAEGLKLSGEVTAADRVNAVAGLQAQGHIPLRVTEIKPGSFRALLSRDIFEGNRVRSRLLATLIQQLSTLLNAGISVEEALELLAARQEDMVTQRVVKELLRRLRDGASLAEAMTAERNSFPPVVIGMVRAGEASGTLDSVLARLADYLIRSQAVRQAVRSALIYPATLVVTALLTTTMIFTVLLPQLASLFEGAGPTLPLSARLMFGLSNFLDRWWWAVALVAATSAILVYRQWQDPANAMRRDALLLRLPLVGATIRHVEAARFARTLGALVGGGVDVPTALALTQPVILNHVMAAAVARVATNLREGSDLAGPLARTGVFPDLAIQLIRIGEATGRLDAMLLQQAEIFDEEVRRTIGRLLAMLVPVLTILLGFLIAGIVASITAAMLSINTVAS